MELKGKAKQGKARMGREGKGKEGKNAKALRLRKRNQKHSCAT